MTTGKPPIVMTIAGSDPTGGAGISADIEAIISQGCHAAPVISCIAVQNTRDVDSVHTIDATLLTQQARAALEDLPIAAIKIGLLGDVEGIEAVAMILQDYQGIPVILDPVLAAGGGSVLSSEMMHDAMRQCLLPLTTVITPNLMEALTLAERADSPTTAALALLEMGCEFVLLTGTHDTSPEVNNKLFGQNGLIQELVWPRLPDTYHGSGCTLSAALAALLAQGVDLLAAAQEAQEYTWHSLKQGYRLGIGQHHPDRLFWARADADEYQQDESGS